MSSVGKAIGKVVGGITGSGAAAEGAEKAAGTQAAASQAAIDEQRRQFDAIQKLLSPYVTAGTGALTAQQNLLGLGGTGAQQQAIAGLESSPIFQALARQGETALLQNASATGGVRGGNIQGALAQFRPAMLNQQIQQQLANLGGITNLGQASAVQQAAAGQSSAANIGNLLGQQGAAIAGGQIAKAGQQYQAFRDITGLLGAAKGAGAF